MYSVSETLTLLQSFFPERALSLNVYLTALNREAKAFPDWRENQLVKLIGQLISNADEMKMAFEQKRIMRLAWAIRNLLELSIWVDYCNTADNNAERFHRDAARDALGWSAAIQAIAKRTLGQSDAALDAGMADLATKFKLGKVDVDFKKVSAAAKEVGRQQEFLELNKMLSKYAHPTAWSISSVLPAAVEADEDLRIMFLRDGVGFAVKSIDKMRSVILAALPPSKDNQIKNSGQ